MPSWMYAAGPLKARLRECWVLAEDRRVSADFPNWTSRPTIHAIVVEWVGVDPSHRRQGHCKRFLAMLCDDPSFDLVIVEAVQNTDLAAHLTASGWEVDAQVSDYHWSPYHAAVR